jgi:hypothetical protein
LIAAVDPIAAAWILAGVGGLELTVRSWMVAAGCLVIALCLWWIYFDLADTSVVGRGVLA